MNNLSIIDQFLDTFIRYIDSGFGLISSDMAFLSKTLIGIDVTLAGLFWAFADDSNILARLIRKVLYVGSFAFIISNFQSLAAIIFSSFSSLGLKAIGSPLASSDLFKPGFIAGAGYQAAHPLLDQASRLVGFPEIFTNALTLFVLLLAWLIVLFAFFILSIQLFITILEFKLTSLAGFILVPFALWNKTSFLAERVLGHVLSSGIKMLVLAVIVGIGSTLFSSLASSNNAQDLTLRDAMSLVLGALSLLGIGLFGPSIASGLISGGPQLGAGSVVATTGATAAGATLAASAVHKGASLATQSAMHALRRATSMAPKTSADQTAPAWASRLQRRQTMHNASQTMAHAVHQGDAPITGASPSLDPKEE